MYKPKGKHIRGDNKIFFTLANNNKINYRFNRTKQQNNFD